MELHIIYFELVLDDFAKSLDIEHELEYSFLIAVQREIKTENVWKCHKQRDFKKYCCFLNNHSKRTEGIWQGSADALGFTDTKTPAKAPCSTQCLCKKKPFDLSDHNQNQGKVKKGEMTLLLHLETIKCLGRGEIKPVKILKRLRVSQFTAVKKADKTWIDLVGWEDVLKKENNQKNKRGEGNQSHVKLEKENAENWKGWILKSFP